jgi:hypothetical protein
MYVLNFDLQLNLMRMKKQGYLLALGSSDNLEVSGGGWRRLLLLLLHLGSGTSAIHHLHTYTYMSDMLFWHHPPYLHVTYITYIHIHTCLTCFSDTINHTYM